MAEALLTRVGPNAFTVDADESFLKRLKIGGKLRGEFTVMRNYRFHKKFFALIDTAFDWWEPHGVEWRGEPVAKNKERFRKDVLILAGHGYPVVNVRGDVRMEAKSISFANMDDVEFDAVYNAVLQAILDKVLSRSDAERLNEAVESIMAFT